MASGHTQANEEKRVKNPVTFICHQMDKAITEPIYLLLHKQIQDT